MDVEKENGEIPLIEAVYNEPFKLPGLILPDKTMVFSGDTKSDRVFQTWRVSVKGAQKEDLTGKISLRGNVSSLYSLTNIPGIRAALGPINIEYQLVADDRNPTSLYTTAAEVTKLPLTLLVVINNVWMYNSPETRVLLKSPQASWEGHTKDRHAANNAPHVTQTPFLSYDLKFFDDLEIIIGDKFPEDTQRS